jgi:outer membrane protein assembly factor BamB
MKLKPLLIIAIVIVLSHLNCAAIEPTWTTELSIKPDWIKVTPIGTIIGGTPTSIIGIDPSSGKMLWEINEIKNCPVEAYQPIENSPLVILEGKSNSSVNGNVLKQRLYIINPVTGAIIFNSNASGMKDADSKYFLNNVGLAIIQGKPVDGKGLLTMCVDLKSGKVLWTANDRLKYTVDIFAISKSELLVTSYAFITKIDALTGNEQWRKPLEQKYAKMEGYMNKIEKFAPRSEDLHTNIYFPNIRPDMCIIGTQRDAEQIGSMPPEFPHMTIFVALNYKTGEYLWQNELPFKYPLGMCFATDQGFLITSGASGHYNMVDYASGEFILGKKKLMTQMPDFKCVINAISFLKNGNILFEGAKSKKNRVNIFSLTEKRMLFEKSAEIKGDIDYVQEVGNNVLVGTNQMLCLLNQNDGQWLFETAFETSSWLVGNISDNLYLFENKKGILYQFPKNSTTVPKALNAPISFGGREFANRMDIVDQSIILSSAQNIAKISTDGKVVYNKHFPAPENSFLVKALMAAGTVAGAYAIGMIQTQAEVWNYKQEHNLQYIKYNVLKDPGNENTANNFKYNMENGGFQMMEEIYKKRFGKSTMSVQSQVLVTEDEQKVLNDAKIKAIDKSTGETKMEFGVGKDVTPVYDVDFIDGKLFYLKGASTLQCFPIQ